ncbi:MAG TPA: fumarylacetoacetate hydrolase family protein [Terriglobales bacterium]|nr:fumarylacetoacetate hydrolase family protein [Terriglobales bacterium]
MKYCRFQTEDGIHCGIIETVAGHEVINQVAAVHAEDPFCTEFHPTMTHLPLVGTKLLAPVTPSKIICVGRNYREHAREFGNEPPTELLIFLKPPSAVIGPEEKVVYPPISERVDFEGELAVVIGKRCRNVRADEDVRAYIRGYTCLNDVTARDLQRKDGQSTRGKGFDTFCPVGPVVSDAPDPWKGVTVETRVNGELKQHGTTRDFIFPLDEIIRYCSQVMTLLPGDLIATGTPAGVGPVKAGDVMEISIAGIGTLRNQVIA